MVAAVRAGPLPLAGRLANSLWRSLGLCVQGLRIPSGVQICIDGLEPAPVEVSIQGGQRNQLDATNLEGGFASLDPAFFLMR